MADLADRLEDAIRAADPKQAKALLCVLIKDLRVNSRREILPTYRVDADAVCAPPSSVGRTERCANHRILGVSAAAPALSLS